ncbi:hypothetical protein Sste5346_004374 [Sporothrix stenoceras]|uniref:Uncharacterized protein n=1 Tax=Sporothrix stenoceras TaxID=5173 RepID=A0ABR3Z9C9_9PEZI
MVSSAPSSISSVTSSASSAPYSSPAGPVCNYATIANADFSTGNITGWTFTNSFGNYDVLETTLAVPL